MNVTWMIDHVNHMANCCLDAPLVSVEVAASQSICFLACGFCHQGVWGTLGL